MKKSTDKHLVSTLVAENQALIKELRASREAAAITAELVARQFANLDIVLRELDQRAKNEKTLREDMAEARMATETANLAKSEFLANMSHEIRTPMNGILGMTELVLNSELSKNQRHYLEMVHQSAVRLLKIINDILDFSRVESGKMEADPTTFSLHQSINNSLKMFSLQAEKKGIALELKIDDDVPGKVYADANRLLQILINLVNNAIKFTHKGSVRLKVETTRDAADGNHFLRFSVNDTGIGIEASKQNQIFESFSQADTSTTRNYGGTGLGLAISAQLAKLFDTKIELVSNKGEGSTFWFDCVLPEQPVVEEDPSEIAFDRLHEELPPENLNRISILLAEDEQINQVLATALLEQLGLSVTSVSNGRDAVDEILQNHHHLVLMDLQMPDVDGFEATRQIRLLAGDKGEIPIVALTAHALAKDREKCRQVGMNGFLSKPVELNELKSMLYTHLLPILKKTQS